MCILRHGSVHGFVTQTQWRDARNAREARFIADLYVHMVAADAIEMAIRRLYGLYEADASNNWDLADAWQMRGHFAPHHLQRQAHQQARFAREMRRTRRNADKDKP